MAGVIAFSTGTSFGTMALLAPLVVPLAFSLTSDPSIQLAASASILGGAVFGDHCSPISDTTIMSSMGSGCNHLSHVKTQLPYACLVGIVVIVCGTLPIGFGVSVWLCMALSAVVLTTTIYILGGVKVVDSVPVGAI